MSDRTRYNLFAVCQPGLENIVAAELRSLGIASPRPVPGGVEFRGFLTHVFQVNLWSRTTERVLLRLREFHVTSFRELHRQAVQTAWEEFLTPGCAVDVRTTCRKSRLIHSGGVTERLVHGIGDRLGQPAKLITTDVTTHPHPSTPRPARSSTSLRSAQNALAVPLGMCGPEQLLTGEEDQAAPPNLIVVRVADDQCLISLDTSGALLHVRGYRQATAKAPLRETLAAAMLLSSGWTPDRSLLDPFCGSGTIPIEAALLARRIAPGRRRPFAFMAWPQFDRTEWDALIDRADSAVLGRAPASIQGSDRDAGAIEASEANADRAGVLDAIEFTRRAVSAIEPISCGHVITNPPYGRRVGGGDMRNLYAQLGKVLRQRCAGWRVALLISDVELEHHTGLKFQPIARFSNGGIKVRLVQAEV